jgi:hypothetical protein
MTSDYSVVLPRRPPAAEPASQASTVEPIAIDDINNDPVVIANRARLAKLQELRHPGPVDVNDALHGGSWFLFVLVAIGAACQLFTALGIAWAAGLAFIVDFLALLTFVAVLERHADHMWRQYGDHVTERPPKRQLHWRLLTPGSVYQRVRAHLDALNIDDSELEDALDSLCRPGADNYDFRPSVRPHRTIDHSDSAVA